MSPYTAHTCTAVTPSPTPFPTPNPTPNPTPYPTPNPTPYPTPNPTPYPTNTPTSAPTADCPVTCETDSTRNFVVATHDVERINNHDSYTQHRCYNYNSECVCECIMNENNFQSDTHRGALPGNTIQSVAAQQASGLFWKAPSYKIDADEIAAIRACCTREIAVAPELVGAFTCEQLATVADEVIVANLEAIAGDMSNSKIVEWLHQQDCADLIFDNHA